MKSNKLKQSRNLAYPTFGWLQPKSINAGPQRPPMNRFLSVSQTKMSASDNDQWCSRTTNSHLQLIDSSDIVQLCVPPSGCLAVSSFVIITSRQSPVIQDWTLPTPRPRNKFNLLCLRKFDFRRKKEMKNERCVGTRFVYCVFPKSTTVSADEL